MGGITIVGLGPGSGKYLTKEAIDWLSQLDEVYLRTRHHPVTAELSVPTINSFDQYYETSEKFEDVYSRIIEKILLLGKRTEGVTYAVPGHPYVAEATSPEIARKARELGIPIRIIDGLSFLDPVFSILGLDPFPNLLLCDALELTTQYFPNFQLDIPVLISQIYSREVASNLKLTLMAAYPDEFEVKLIHGAGTPDAILETIPLHELDRSRHLGLISSLYLPELGKGVSLESFQGIIAHLRAPEGCPWDRKQSHESLRFALLEETYEVLEALDKNDPVDLQEELGDLLLQIVMHTQIAAEEGEFRMSDVLKGIATKIIRRHPHVFEGEKLTSTDQVLKNWDEIKKKERISKSDNEKAGILDSVPGALPALAQAQSYQVRVGRVGFDWNEIEPVVQKVREELNEVLSSKNVEELEAEIGDLLFAVVNLSRWHNVDAETALRLTNKRFSKRFSHVEKRVSQLDRNINQMTLEELDVYWEEAKKIEKGIGGQ